MIDTNHCNLLTMKNCQDCHHNWCQLSYVTHTFYGSPLASSWLFKGVDVTPVIKRVGLCQATQRYMVLSTPFLYSLWTCFGRVCCVVQLHSKHLLVSSMSASKQHKCGSVGHIWWQLLRTLWYDCLAMVGWYMWLYWLWDWQHSCFFLSCGVIGTHLLCGFIQYVLSSFSYLGSVACVFFNST